MPVSIINRTPQSIINILVQPSGENEFFIRLDLAPRATDEIDNPECQASLRVDTGLVFWFFDKVNLAGAKSLAFCGEHKACIEIVSGQDGKAMHMRARVQELVPRPGDRPVCELGQFRPRMLMRDVCSIIERDAPRDDNGSILTGLGFGGMLWAARLAPDHDGAADGNAVLEHMELRRPLDSEDALKALDLLFRQGYAPWQAEFPGRDIDFKDSPGQAAQKQLLTDMIKRYMALKGDEEARILMAPASILPALSNADAPEEDVQLFTLILQPNSGTLLLDVAAYEGDKKSGR